MLSAASEQVLALAEVLALAVASELMQALAGVLALASEQVLVVQSMALAVRVVP